MLVSLLCTSLACLMADLKEKDEHSVGIRVVKNCEQGLRLVAGENVEPWLRILLTAMETKLPLAPKDKEDIDKLIGSNFRFYFTFEDRKKVPKQLNLIPRIFIYLVHLLSGPDSLTSFVRHLEIRKGSRSFGFLDGEETPVRRDTNLESKSVNPFEGTQCDAFQRDLFSKTYMGPLQYLIGSTKQSLEDQYRLSRQDLTQKHIGMTICLSLSNEIVKVYTSFGYLACEAFFPILHANLPNLKDLHACEGGDEKKEEEDEPGVKPVPTRLLLHAFGIWLREGTVTANRGLLHYRATSTPDLLTTKTLQKRNKDFTVPCNTEEVSQQLFAVKALDMQDATMLAILMKVATVSLGNEASLTLDNPLKAEVEKRNMETNAEIARADGDGVGVDGVGDVGSEPPLGEDVHEDHSTPRRRSNRKKKAPSEVYTPNSDAVGASTSSRKKRKKQINKDMTVPQSSPKRKRKKRETGTPSNNDADDGDGPHKAADTSPQSSNKAATDETSLQSSKEVATGPTDSVDDNVHVDADAPVTDAQDTERSGATDETSLQSSKEVATGPTDSVDDNVHVFIEAPVTDAQDTERGGATDETSLQSSKEVAPGPTDSVDDNVHVDADAPVTDAQDTERSGATDETSLQSSKEVAPGPTDSVDDNVHVDADAPVTDAQDTERGGATDETSLQSSKEVAPGPTDSVDDNVHVDADAPVTDAQDTERSGATDETSLQSSKEVAPGPTDSVDDNVHVDADAPVTDAQDTERSGATDETSLRQAKK